MSNKPETRHPQFRQIVTGHFREGPSYQNWRAHGTESWLIVLTLEGGGQFGHAQGALRTAPGQVALIQPGICHDYGTQPNAEYWDLLWAHFHPRPHWHAWLGWPEVAPGLMSLMLTEPVVRQKVQGCFQEAHRLATGALRHREEFAMNALEAVLLWCSTADPHTTQGRRDPRVTRCLDYLCEHLSEIVTVADLADRAVLSPSRLAHLFRAQVGMTPQQFHEQQRLERAKQLLELSGRGIGEIAAEVGYENPFYFTLRFKKWTGFSPSDYRKRQIMSHPSPPG
jgi:AraC family transcriptional regulator of arabinose operon